MVSPEWTGSSCGYPALASSTLSLPSTDIYDKLEDFKRPLSKSPIRTLSNQSTPRKFTRRPSTAPGLFQTIENYTECCVEDDKVKIKSSSSYIDDDELKEVIHI
ncbi:uncharacterized protein LOC144751931 [Ciona intestinalis]